MSNRKLIKEVWITDAVGEEGSGFFFKFECHVLYFTQTNCCKICRESVCRYIRLNFFNILTFFESSKAVVFF